MRAREEQDVKNMTNAQIQILASDIMIVFRTGQYCQLSEY